jgi:DNA polymerase III epsilon subunit-like protein
MNLSDSYLVLDIETTSLQPAQGCILQFGWLQCIRAEVTSRGGIFVACPEDELRMYEQGSYVQRQIRDGNDGYVKAADVRQHGVSRPKVYHVLRELLQTTMQLPEAVVVGHNLTGFDIPFVEYHMQKEGFPFKFDRERVFDTGAMFKANRLGLLPRDDEPVWDFFCRVRDIRARGVLWNLAFAVREYGLVEKHSIDTSAAHDAAADTLMTHYLYKEMRERFAELAA